MVEWNPAIWSAFYRCVNLNRQRSRKPCSKNNDFNYGLLSSRHLEMFWHTQENIRNIQLRFVFLNIPFVCQNISACLKLSRLQLAIVYCYKKSFHFLRWCYIEPTPNNFNGATIKMHRWKTNYRSRVNRRITGHKNSLLKYAYFSWMYPC